MPGADVADRLPLPTLLSQPLVAYTIEFDNEFEREMPSRTTRYNSTAGSRHAPWCASRVMWSTCMRFLVDEAGRPVHELEHLARTPTNLAGMQRWGYVVVEPDPADDRPKPPRSDWVVRPTRAGRKAQHVWGPLDEVIERRWEQRFGAPELERIRGSLSAVVSRLDVELPECLPILGFGLLTQVPDPEPRTHGRPGEAAGLPLPTLLSQALLTFALEFDRESGTSLAISANVLRVLDASAVPVRDLPRLSGVSKEAISMATGVLQKRRLAVVEPDSTRPRTKIIRLTRAGRDARDSYPSLVGVIEQRWRDRFGDNCVRDLRESLEPLIGEPGDTASPLFGGLVPDPGGWRASVRPPATLPHYPTVLHRGGYPDGS